MIVSNREFNQKEEILEFSKNNAKPQRKILKPTKQKLFQNTLQEDNNSNSPLINQISTNNDTIQTSYEIVQEETMKTQLVTQILKFKKPIKI